MEVNVSFIEHINLHFIKRLYCFLNDFVCIDKTLKAGDKHNFDDWIVLIIDIVDAASHH